jgi:hypothetical protein
MQIKFRKVTATSVFMYGSENWILNKSEKKEVETAEMRF